MANLTKKAFTFDLDTKALQKYYPKGDWHNAYSDIKNFFARNNIEHIQGSAYHSKEPMAKYHAVSVINDLTKEFPWLNHCMKVCTINIVPKEYDVTHVFRNESNRLLMVEMKEKILKEISKGKSFSRIEKAIKVNSKFDGKTLAILSKIKQHEDIKAIIAKENEYSR